MDNAVFNFVKVAGMACYYFFVLEEIPPFPKRQVNVFVDGANICIESRVVGKIVKVGKTWVATADDGTTGATAKTRKAAVLAFAEPRCLAYFAPKYTHPLYDSGKPFEPRPCGTCGSKWCRSRFDCSPGAPNDWQ